MRKPWKNIPAIQVSCPKCGALAGTQCKWSDDDWKIRFYFVHKERWRNAPAPTIKTSMKTILREHKPKKKQIFISSPCKNGAHRFCFTRKCKCSCGHVDK